jgi:shikimate kinase
LKSAAVSHSAITVVSAFATGKGVTIGTDLSCRVTAEVIKRKRSGSKVIVAGSVDDSHGLIMTCVQNSIRQLGALIPADSAVLVKVESDIPMAVGLKSSSSASVAAVSAIFNLFSHVRKKPLNTQDLLRTSCEASIESGASLTGAFDDAAASYLGGLVFSDNLRFKLLAHRELPSEYGTVVKILVPPAAKLTSSLKLSDYHQYNKQIRDAIEFASDGIIVQAMLLNSTVHALIHKYSLQPIVSSILEGASSAGISGKGPAVAAICPKNKIAQNVEERWKSENPESRVITTKVTKPRAG